MLRHQAAENSFTTPVAAKKELFSSRDNEQLLDEVEHDSDNYQGQSLTYLPKPKAEAVYTN